VVAAVAAENENIALKALDLIEVEYEILGSVHSVEEARSSSAPELFPVPPRAIVPPYGAGATGAVRTARNVCYEFRYETGPESAWDDCDHVFEDMFAFSRMYHMHLEPFVTVATAADERIEVWTATQSPFPMRKDLAGIFKIPENRVRVHVGTLGGGFGAKNGARTEPIAVRLAQLSGRPVRYCLSLEECFLTVSQHEAVLRLRTGVKSDGTFVARQSEVLLNAGAYADLSPLVCEKAGYRMPGAYRWQRIDTVCQAILTNTVPAGAYRGFGGTQATWASERQVDLIAERLGIDPLELRLHNLKRLGEEFAPGDTVIDSDLHVGLDIVADAIGYHDRPRIPGRGMGLAIGIKDGGGVNKPAQARVKVSTGGDIYLHSALIEMGQGGHTALPQIVAEILGADPERVSYVPVDTDHSPFDQGTNASSGIAVMGQAVQQAAEGVRDKALAFAAEQLGVPVAELTLRDWTVVHDGTEHPLAPMIMRVYGGTGFEFTADGDFKATESHLAPLEAPCVFWEIGWAAAEVAVDEETGQVTVLQLVVSGDAGRVINAIGCRGQDEGAAVFGLGQALFEELRYDGTALLNGEALDYRVPLAEDIPARFTSITQEQGHGAGPFGSKGMGEGTMLPVAPAIAQAIADATGAQLTALPMSPERVLTALDDRISGPSCR
jgi:CO/xanthine dehydrogenase Mo-binding subunit